MDRNGNQGTSRHPVTESGFTSFNSGNTFPSLFDAMGRTCSVNLKFTF